MSSYARRLQLKIARKAGKIKKRYKAVNTMKGQPYRNCLITKRDPETGAILEWVRYH